MVAGYIILGVLLFVLFCIYVHLNDDDYKETLGVVLIIFTVVAVVSLSMINSLNKTDNCYITDDIQYELDNVIPHVIYKYKCKDSISGYYDVNESEMSVLRNYRIEEEEEE